MTKDLFIGISFYSSQNILYNNSERVKVLKIFFKSGRGPQEKLKKKKKKDPSKTSLRKNLKNPLR
jgi:hypothetical protein